MKEIIKENKNNIKKIIKNITGYANEDIEQEVYIKIWRGIKNNSSILKLSQWINAITANTCKDFLKSKQHKTEKLKIDDETIMESVCDVKTPEKIVNSKQRQKLILKAVDELPKKMKEVIILFEFEEKTYEEISQKLKVPVGTVKSRLFCARTVLKEELKEIIGD